MSNDDRGTYSPPTEDNLSYETRRRAPRDQAPVTLIISAICLVVLLAIVVVLYNTGMSKHGKIAPEVGDSIGDFKDGQVQDAKPLSDTDMSLSDGQNVQFAPGTEAPASRTADKDVAPPPVAPIAGPLPSQTSAAAPAASQAPASSATTTASPPPAQTATPPLRSGIASSSAAEPAVKPAAKPATTAPATPKPATTTASTTAKPAASGTSVQIGAYESTDVASAEYAKVASSYGLFVGGAGKKVEKVVTGNGTFYRTMFTGLTPDKAKAFCSALKANGRDCIIR